MSDDIPSLVQPITALGGVGTVMALFFRAYWKQEGRTDGIISRLEAEIARKDAVIDALSEKIREQEDDQ